MTSDPSVAAWFGSNKGQECQNYRSFQTQTQTSFAADSVLVLCALTLRGVFGGVLV